MRRYDAYIFVLASLVVPGVGVSGGSGDRIMDSGIKERLSVHGTVTEKVAATVIPPSNHDARTCTGLSAKDFALKIDGRSRGFTLEPGGITKGGTARHNFVILLSATDLSKPVCGFGTYQIAKAQALDWAERAVPTILEGGDLLGISVFSDTIGKETIRKGAVDVWTSSSDEALAMIRSAEPDLVYPAQEHTSSEFWFQGLEQLARAWSEAAGGEDVTVLLPTGPLPHLGQNPARERRLAATLAANNVRILPVNLSAKMASRRSYELLADLSGGIAFGGIKQGANGIELAVQRIRQLDQCRYLLRFPLSKAELTKDVIGTRAELAANLTSAGFSVAAPAAVTSPERIPPPHVRLQTFLMLQGASEGFHVEGGIFPLSARHAVVVARVTVANHELQSLARLSPERLPDVLGNVTVHIVVRSGNEFIGDWTRNFSGQEELSRLIESGHTLPFLLTRVPDGALTYQVGVIPEKSKKFGAYSGERHVDLAPDGWWIASPHLVDVSLDPSLTRLRELLPRTASGASFIPSVALTQPTGKPLFAFSNTCRPPAAAEVVGEEASLPVMIRQENPDRGCGWVAATIPALTPGTWRFVPSKAGGGDRAPLVLTVTEAAAAAHGSCSSLATAH